jgi:hypothetical protein
VTGVAAQPWLALCKGGECGFESGDSMSRSYMYLHLPIIYTFRNIIKKREKKGLVERIRHLPASSRSDQKLATHIDQHVSRNLSNFETLAFLRAEVMEPTRKDLL